MHSYDCGRGGLICITRANCARRLTFVAAAAAAASSVPFDTSGANVILILRGSDQERVAAHLCCCRYACPQGILLWPRERLNFVLAPFSPTSGAHILLLLLRSSTTWLIGGQFPSVICSHTTTTRGCRLYCISGVFGGRRHDRGRGRRLQHLQWGARVSIDSQRETIETGTLVGAVVQI